MAASAELGSNVSQPSLARVPSHSGQSEVEKYLRFLCLKAVHVIVEARLGERVSTPSKPNSVGSDWFNISLNDLPEVRAETKRALNGALPSPGNPLCVEISLKTADGDVMVLECWQLCVDEQSPTSSPVSTSKSGYQVYNGMSRLLKSVLVVTRTTPAYRVSRRQSSDSYVICYRVDLGRPALDALGPETKLVKMGPISSPMGSVTMEVTYRTRLTLSPHKLDRSAPVMLKSDHFEAGGAANFAGASASFAGGVGRGSEDMRGPDKNIGGWFDKQSAFARKNYPAFVDYGSTEDASSTSDQCLVPDLTASFPFPWVADSSDSSASSARTDSLNVGAGQRGGPVSSSSSSASASASASATASGTMGVPARQPTSSLVRARPSTDRLSVASSSESPPPDDFVVVGTSPPFASKEPDCDLGAFYHTMRTATPLLSSFDDQIDSVEEQLRSLEVDKKEFDHFVQELSSRDDMTVSEATAADMSDDEDEETRAQKEEEARERRNGGGGRSAAVVPMPLTMTSSLWMAC